jgi:hypothetical protein
MIRGAVSLAALGWLVVAAAAETPAPSLEAALQQAQARQQPVLLSFAAPWCYSCYYMSQHVLTGEEWSAVQEAMVVLTLDADAPEGARVREARQVTALPSYLLLTPEGEEVGRILGEQNRSAFYAQLEALSRRRGGLTQLEATARNGSGDEAVAAAVAVFKAYHARRDAETGLAWWLRLPMATRSRLAESAEVRLGRDRLAFLAESESGSPQACAALAAEVLSAPALGCEAAYELGRLLGCAEQLPADAQSQALAPQRERLLADVDAVLGDVPTACADGRSLISTQVRLYRALGDADAAEALLDRAVRHHRAALARNGLADRHRADDLRVYLELQGDEAARDALLREQVAAFPETYIYAFRLGRALLARGEAEAALPYLAQASERAYGINRLRVAEQQARALLALAQPLEARRVVMQALKANGPWFSEDAAALRDLVSGKS